MYVKHFPTDLKQNFKTRKFKKEKKWQKFTSTRQLHFPKFTERA